MFSALVVDDHPVTCEGISKILRKIPHISRCDTAYNGKSAIEAIGKHPYKIVIMDLHMPVMDGYEATDIIMKKFPYSRIIILSMVDSKREIVTLLDKGVRGYLLKSSDSKEITTAVQKVLDDQIYLSEDVNRIWGQYLLEKKEHHKLRTPHEELTSREKDVIRMICEQFTCIEISEKLNISESTVKNHRANIMKKLETDNSIGIALYAVRAGLYIP
jgi:DNA-binding NarL/FixJ family response regulator